MTLLTIDEIKEFERELDATLDALPSLRCDGETTIALACDAIEIYHKDPKHHYTAAHFDRGLDVLLPIWITSKGTEEPQIEQLLGDLHFASSYYMLREYLYYTYNAPETLNWYRDHDGNISIKINDPTLTRQYYLKTSNGFVGSMETFKDNDTENILALVRGTDEFGPHPIAEELVALIMNEVDRKLSVYFNFLDGVPHVQLGPYTFGTYKAVFRMLVFRALYHRYHSMANGKFGIVQDSEDSLINMMTANSIATVRAGIKRLHFGRFGGSQWCRPSWRDTRRRRRPESGPATRKA